MLSFFKVSNDKKKILMVSIALLAALSARAQNHRMLGSASLVYELPRIITIPPLYSGQPVDVSEAYLLFDQELRKSNLGGTDHFFQRMGYGDTSKYILNLLYRVDDDNPLSFYSYKTSSPATYLCGAGYAYQSLCTNIPRMYQDSGITLLLTLSDIISDVRVTDTAFMLDTFASPPLRVVSVSCRILDEIKGKMVPECPPLYLSSKSRVHPLSTAPYLTTAVPADTGSCLQFQYSLDWYSDTIGWSLHKLGDSVNGDWIRRDSEYIVFLNIYDLTRDTSHHDYFTIDPVVGWGACVCMYPVRNGIVYDPNNDFGFGQGLTPDEFKSKLRSRIYSLTHP